MKDMPHTTRTYENLVVNIYPDRDIMGKGAAEHVASLIQELHVRQQVVNIIFAAAPSQNEFLDHLTSMKGIEWSRVIGFHMDEYIGLPGESEQLFSRYLMNHLFSKVQMKEVYILDAVAKDPVKECARYAELLKSHPIDIVCMGIGENGHVAFVDPPVADFNDPLLVKVVELDEPCRQQQVNDGCFASFADVPTHAITLTVPQLMSARYLSIVVPSERKAIAVHNALLGPVTTRVPASILRRHDHAMLFIDETAAVRL
jgi:glucosamine-6-phosphate deaminase